MRLYYSPGACSMAVHIALYEAELEFEAVKVDLATHRLENGDDYASISPRGYVPLLELDDGSRHTEAAALLQYVGDLDRHQTLMPQAPLGRLAVTEWLAFISTELHRTLSPWLFRDEIDASAKAFALAKFHKRLAEVDATLASRDYLTGASFCVADAYCFTIVGWSRPLKIDLSPYPNVKAYLSRVAKRPKVRAAMMAEGLVKVLG